ncbi:MAG: phage major capsid protein [Clostridia bacterium]|nr:phage major capsid protein [Clostridia bacterium]
MVTLTTADNALKSFYLDAVSEQLNTKANPFLAKIQRSTSDVWGKDVRKMVKIGVNGGIAAGTETGSLPTASNNDYVQFVAPLKNLYGTIEISDKAIRASQNNEGAFVNLLNDEMQSLVKSASFNFGRMLFGDGTGKLGEVMSVSDTGVVTMNTVKNIVEGMILNYHNLSGSKITLASGRRVVAVDRVNKTVTLAGSALSETQLPAGSSAYVQTSKDSEITGLAALFDETLPLYGVDRAAYGMLTPYKKTDVGEISEDVIQTAIDAIEESSGSKVNFIVCSWGVRRALAAYFRKYMVAMPTMEFEGGVKALSFNGIPVIADRFCPDGTMYLLNTDDFKIHQLCDWQWLEGDDGKVLKQTAGKPVYTATLVKYAELMCDRPNGQGMLSGITEA